MNGTQEDKAHWECNVDKNITSLRLKLRKIKDTDKVRSSRTYTNAIPIWNAKETQTSELDKVNKNLDPPACEDGESDLAQQLQLSDSNSESSDLDTMDKNPDPTSEAGKSIEQSNGQPSLANTLNTASGAVTPIEQSNGQPSLANTLNAASGAVPPFEQSSDQPSLANTLNTASGAVEQSADANEIVIDRPNRTRFLKWQVDELKRVFQFCTYPNNARCADLADKLNLKHHQVYAWFQNRRVR